MGTGNYLIQMIPHLQLNKFYSDPRKNGFCYACSIFALVEQI